METQTSSAPSALRGSQMYVSQKIFSSTWTTLKASDVFSFFRYHFCEKCFNEIQGDSVTLGDDPAQPQTWVNEALSNANLIHPEQPNTHPNALLGKIRICFLFLFFSN